MGEAIERGLCCTRDQFSDCVIVMSVSNFTTLLNSLGQKFGDFTDYCFGDFTTINFDTLIFTLLTVFGSVTFC